MSRMCLVFFCFFFFSSRRRHTRLVRDWSSDVCSSDLQEDFYIILKNAQDQGLAHTDINMKSAAIVYINIVNSTFQPEFFLKNDLPIRDTIHGFVQIVARGIFNEKGMKAVNQYYKDKI